MTNLSEYQLDDELFREMNCSWDKKLLINHIIEGMKLEIKRDWVKEWFDNEN